MAGPPPPPSPPGGSTTTTTTTTASSTPSAPAGPTQAQIQAERNAIATYANLLSSWGIEVTPSLENWIKGEVQQGVGSSQFLQDVRGLKDYAQQFPGIIRNDGTMRMTESQYLSGFHSAQNFAASVGRSMTKQAYGFAIKNGNSPAEIQAKLQAEDILLTHADVLSQFSDYLVTTGAIPKPLTRDELRAFIMKQGPKALEQEWQMAYAGSQIEAAGINVGKPSAGNDIGYQALQVLIRNAGPGVDITKVDYGQLAQLVQTALPVSELYQGGITKKNLVSLTLGGPKAEPIARRVQALVSTYAARFDPQAIPQLTQGGMITGSPQSVQTTE